MGGKNVLSGNKVIVTQIYIGWAGDWMDGWMFGDLDTWVGYMDGQLRLRLH